MAAAAGTRRAEIWIPADKVEALFGTLGTSSHVAGAEVKLLDCNGEESARGRKAEIVGARPAVRRAADAVVAKLRAAAGCIPADTAEPAVCDWSYLHPQTGQPLGPFSWERVTKWISHGKMPGDTLMERGDVHCWLPLWLAHVPAAKPAPAPSAPAADANGMP